MAKAKEDKLTIKQGRSNSNVIWIGLKAYQIIDGDILMFGGGGIEVEEETELVRAFIKRNKKTYFKYESVEHKEFKAVFTFGKHTNKSVEEVRAIDKPWITWCRDNFKFSSAQKELKEQIEEILKT